MTPRAGATRIVAFAPEAPGDLMQHLPRAQGLYDPAHEHHACGVALVVDVPGRPSHRSGELGFAALRNRDPRGAKGAEATPGEGAGMLFQVPDGFLRAVVDFPLPPAGAYAVGLAFLPRHPAQADL